MPEIDVGRYLIDCLLEWGPVRSSGMGVSALKPDQVAACADALGIGRLAPWEIRAICHLSAVYSGEAHKAEKQGARAPWLAPGEKPEPTANQLAARAAAEDAKGPAAEMVRRKAKR